MKDLILKIHLLKQENLRFENKWEMSFTEFEQKSPNMPNGMSYETEKEYYQWEGIITDMEYYAKELKQCT